MTALSLIITLIILLILLLLLLIFIILLIIIITLIIWIYLETPCKFVHAPAQSTGAAEYTDCFSAEG